MQNNLDIGSEAHPGLHSDIFDDIRNMPTGQYGAQAAQSVRNKALSPEQQKLSQLAGLSSAQVQKKLESDFKNIFSAQDASPMIDSHSKFPKITQIQQFSDRQKAQSKASASKADALRANSKARVK